MKNSVFTQTAGNSFLLKTNCKPYYFITMSTQLLIQMLRKGSNGEEILNILDAITGNTVTAEDPSTTQPTLDEIAF